MKTILQVIFSDSVKRDIQNLYYNVELFRLQKVYNAKFIVFHPFNSIHLEMLDYLIRDNNLKDVLLQEGITDQDILFIKELIAGYINPTTGNLPFGDSWL